ncbi:MAG: endonuclease/exonuclease/phosphatase family protein, partial [Mangrovicoccus sp.]
ERGKAADVAYVIETLDRIAPDIILLTRFDYDYELAALRALNDRLAKPYPHLFAQRPNTGRPSGLDLDGDGRLGEPEDAISYGRFNGQNGMAILSRLPFVHADFRDFSALLWRDFPQARVPEGIFSTAALEKQRLSTVGHWDIPVALPDGGRLYLWAYHASPPVFDGPEDRNGRRSADETQFWQSYLDGRLDTPARVPFVLMGNSNLDATLGEGLRSVMAALLADPRLTDPAPTSEGGRALDHPLATVDWRGVVEPGAMRVDYVLPSADLTILAAGIDWPELHPPQSGDDAASRHHMVWVDIALPNKAARPVRLDPPDATR